jgi:hypothetical protein
MKSVHRPSPSFLGRALLLAVGLFGVERTVAADQIVTFNLVGVTYGGTGVLNGTFTYDFTTHHWATCSFLGGAIIGNPFSSPVTITTTTIAGAADSQTTSYNFEFILASAFTPTTGAAIALDPPGTPTSALTSYFSIDNGLGLPNSVTTYPITGGSVVCAGDAAFGSIVCAADNSTWTCPCGNNSNAYSGCGNSVNPAGASLTNAGLPQVSADQARLDVVGVPASTSCLFFQGTSIVSPATAFGDGLRCASGTVIRLGTITASNGAASYPGPSDAPIHVRGQVPSIGGTRIYQVWYRNAASYCTASTFNTSNGLSVQWTP